MSKISDRLDRIETKLDFILSKLDPPTDYHCATTIEDAIDSEVVLGFHYVKLDGTPSVRIISPYEVRGTTSGDHLVGYDHNRDGLRQFALRRIERITPLDDYPFVAQDAAPIVHAVAPEAFTLAGAPTTAP